MYFRKKQIPHTEGMGIRDHFLYRIDDSWKRDAKTEDLFKNPLHPYTKGLLDSIPRIGQNAERLHTIPGVVPNLLHLSQGCPFSNRCEYATDQCRTEKAQLHPVAPDHQVRCFRCEEEHQ